MANTRFRGMTALVTGASSGIGAETAVALARWGAFVFVHYNHNQKGAEGVIDRIRAVGEQGETIHSDLCQPLGIHQLIDGLAARNATIDILVNNVGSLVKRTRFLEFTEELWNEVITLNLSSAVFLSQAVLPKMVERKRGFIVNVSSVAARNGGGLGAIAYSTAKGALSTFTKGLAKEFAPSGIRINAVSPGTIDTNYHRVFSTPQVLESIVASTPLQRLGTPEEIADVVVFLCSDEARFIHGQVIEVNGGFLMV